MDYELNIDLGVVDEHGGLADVGEGSRAFISRVRETLQQAIQQAANENNTPPSRIFLTHPPHWSEQRRQLVLAAAAAENIPPEVLELRKGAPAAVSQHTHVVDPNAVVQPDSKGPAIQSRAGSMPTPPRNKTAAMPPEVLASLQTPQKQPQVRRGLIVALIVAMLVTATGLYSLSSESDDTTSQSDSTTPNSTEDETADDDQSPSTQTSSPDNSVAESSAPMPEVVGMTVADATNTLEQLGLLVQTQQDSTVVRPQGEVAHQSIAVDQLVTAGDTVVLTVSTGEAVGQVPYVIGMSQSQATEILQAAGLTNIEVRVVPDRDAPAGQVVRTVPRPGSEHEPGSPLKLFIAAPAGLAEVPDVVGLAQVEAVAALADAGFDASVEFVDLDDPTATQGKVISQDPEAGTKRPAGATVDLEVGQRQ